MAFARVSFSTRLLRPSSTPSTCLHFFLHPFSTSPVSTARVYHPRNFSIDAAAVRSDASPLPSNAQAKAEVMEASRSSSRRPWKPTCLYHTQGKCTMMLQQTPAIQTDELGYLFATGAVEGKTNAAFDFEMNDALHLEKFSHSLLLDLPVNASAADKVKPQNLDYLLILDLEGKIEILEFPVLMIDAHSMEFIDSFHRFVHPTAMSEQRIREYIEGKYGKFGVDRVWHDTAMPFEEVLREFEEWINCHKLWKQKQGGPLNNAAFITCGNWDLKTKVPEQCKVSKIKLPSYFMEWINLKDIYLNFYNRRATGMMAMMRELQMPIVGSHHLGIDDAKNITRVVQSMLADGAVMQITAKRYSDTKDVKFLFKNRIR